MKIALVSPYDLSVPGGVNSHILPLARAISLRGSRSAGHRPRLGPDGTPRRPRRAHRYRPAVSGSGQRFHSPHSPFRSACRPGQERCCRTERFDVVHVHEPLMPLLPIQFLRFSERSERGHIPRRREGGIVSTPTLAGCLRAAGIESWTARSPSRRPLRHWSAVTSPAYYNIIPNGVDVERFGRPLEPTAGVQLDGKRNILFLGRSRSARGSATCCVPFTAVKREMPEHAPDHRRRRPCAAALRALRSPGEPRRRHLYRLRRQRGSAALPAVGGHLLLAGDRK